MKNSQIYFAIILLMVSTIVMRSGFLLFGKYVKLSARLQKALTYAPAAAIASIIVQAIFFVQGQLMFSWNNHRLIAAVPAALFFLWKKSMLGCIIVGMFFLTALRNGFWL